MSETTDRANHDLKPPALRMPADFRQDLVSVIMPVYNREWILEETLDCIREQTYRPIELVVVDDGSTDRTPDVVRAFGESSGEGIRLTCLRQENLGANAARNRGLEASRGEFIQFLDSDDLIVPEKLSRQVEVMGEQPRVQYVFARWQILYQESGRKGDPWPEDFTPDRQDLLDAMITLYAHPTLPVCSINGLYRRSLCRRIGPWETRWQIHDRHYHTRMLLLGEPYRFIPPVHAYVRLHEGFRAGHHAARAGRLASHRLGWHAMEALFEEAGEINLRRRRILARSYRDLAGLALGAGAPELARRFTADALRTAPAAFRLRLRAEALFDRMPGAELLRAAAHSYDEGGAALLMKRTLSKLWSRPGPA